MSYRKQILAILCVALVFFGVSYYLVLSEEVGLCLKNDVSCGNHYDALAAPFFLGMPSLFLVSLFLLFSRESTYLAWRKFAMWAIPIAAVLLFLAPTDSPGGIGIGGGDFTRETASWLFSVLFLVTSIIIIARASVKAHPATPKVKPW